MTLRDALKKIDINVSVGAKNGSSYLYIGEPNEEAIAKSFLDHRDDKERTLENYRHTFENCKKSLFEYENGKQIPLSDSEKEKGPEYAKRKLEDKIKSLNSTIELMKSQIPKLERYLEEYTPVLERDVCDVSRREPLIEPDNIRIIVEGQETGKYWFSSEVKGVEGKG